MENSSSGEHLETNMPKRHVHPLDRVIDLVAQTLGALATLTGLVGSGPAITQNFAAIMWQGGVGLTGWTTGEGPLLYGIMDADLSLAELEEYLELNGPIRANQVPQSEKAKRPVQVIGIVGGPGDPVWHPKVQTRLPAFREDVGWAFWVYNMGPAALSTGSTFTWLGTMFGRWID